jgi:hypothetical protein
MKRQLILSALSLWQSLANKLGYNDMTTNDIIMVEVIRRQNMMIREIESSTTMIDLLHCKACIKSYITDAFEFSLVKNSISILNSHYAWKRLELKQREPKPKDDVITERELDDEIHD